MKRVLGRVLLLLIGLCAMLLSSGCGSSGSSKSSAAGTEVYTDYPNAGLLVSGESVQAELGTGGLVIIDARRSGYNTAHIPGAIHMDYGDYFTAGVGLKKTATLAQLLGKAGLTRGSKIIIYDNTTASWGAAGRIFWMLEYLGCGDVHILNGGWDKWVADGRATETTVNTLPEKTFTASVNAGVRADKNYILSRLGKENFAIIDPREDEEYNGWTLYGETRGGHVSGAVSINYKWFFNKDKTILSYSDLKNLLENRGIKKDKEVSTYCTAGIRSGFVYFALRLMGYPKCSNYDASMYEWSADSSCPMAKMPNYHKLVYPGWVKALIAGGNPGTSGTPPTYLGKKYVIIRAMSQKDGDSTADYDAGHIPGAIHFNFYRLEPNWPVYPYTKPSDGNLKPDADLQATIESLGITHDTTVIIYNNGSPSGRLAWALMYAGVEDVRILNGGWGAWVADGGTIETTPNTPVPVAFGKTVPVHPEYLATTSYVDALRVDPSGVLADIRRWEEYIGTYHSYLHANFERRGHIPGAVWAHDNPEYYDAADNTLRSYTEIEQLWKGLGITPDKKVGFV